MAVWCFQNGDLCVQTGIWAEKWAFWWSEDGISGVKLGFLVPSGDFWVKKGDLWGSKRVLLVLEMGILVKGGEFCLKKGDLGLKFFIFLWRTGDWGAKMGLFGSEEGDFGEQCVFWCVQWRLGVFQMGIFVFKRGFGLRNGHFCGPKTGFQG